jgi:hypothetical protein
MRSIAGHRTAFWGDLGVDLSFCGPNRTHLHVPEGWAIGEVCSLWREHHPVSGTGASDREFTPRVAATLRLFHVTTTAMDTSASWPASDGNGELPMFRELATVIKDRLTPDPMHHQRWARRSLAEHLSQASENEDALWASVLGLWRLRYLEPILNELTEEARKLWQSHVSAWLVSGGRRWRLGPATHVIVLQHRHFAICRIVRIQAFPVVREYGDEMLEGGNLEPDHIPPWESARCTPAPPGSSHPSAPDSATDGDSDVEMFDVPPALAERLQNPPTIAPMAKAESTGPNAGARSGLPPQSPARSEEPSIRTRSAMQTSPAVMYPSEELDLSKDTYDNWSRVNGLLVPKVIGAVSCPVTAFQTGCDVKTVLQTVRQPRAGQRRMLRCMV